LYIIQKEIISKSFWEKCFLSFQKDLPKYGELLVPPIVFLLVLGDQDIHMLSVVGLPLLLHSVVALFVLGNPFGGGAFLGFSCWHILYNTMRYS